MLLHHPPSALADRGPREQTCSTCPWRHAPESRSLLETRGGAIWVLRAYCIVRPGTNIPPDNGGRLRRRINTDVASVLQYLDGEFARRRNL